MKLSVPALLNAPHRVDDLTAGEAASVLAAIAAQQSQLAALALVVSLRLHKEPAPVASEQVLTLEQVRQRLLLSKDTVARLVHTGELPSVKVGRCYRVTESALAQWLNQHTR